MKNIEKGMGGSKLPEEQDEKLIQEITREINKLKEQGVTFDRPDEEVIRDLAAQWREKYPKHGEAPMVPYVEWDADRCEIWFIDELKKRDDSGRTSVRKE